MLFNLVFGYSIDGILRSLNRCVTRLEALQARNNRLMEEKLEDIRLLEQQHESLRQDAERAHGIVKNIKKLTIAE